jgi:hypothetical protein
VDLKGSLDVQDVPDAEPAHSLATSIDIVQAKLLGAVQMIAEFAIDLTDVLPDGPEVFADSRLTRRDRAIGRVEGLVAHRRSLCGPSSQLTITDSRARQRGVQR